MAQRTKGRRKTGAVAQLLAAADRARPLDLPGAVLAWGKALELQPGNPRALTGLRALGFDERRQVLDACRALVNAGATPHALALSGILARANPADPQIAAFETRALVITKATDAALARIRPFLDSHPDLAAIRVAAGIAMAFSGDHAAAVAQLLPLSDDPALDAEAINVLGTSLAFLGRLDDSGEVLMTAARAGRLSVAGLYNLTRQTDMSGETAIARTLQQVLDDPAAPRADREMAAFGLAKVQEDRGDTAMAFRYLAQGNGLKPEADVIRFMDAARSAATRARDTVARLAAGEPVTAPGPRPVFIVGMPRSGSTLVEQILLGHSRVASLGESTRLSEALRRMEAYTGPPDPVRLRDAYFEALPPEAAAAEVVLDKMPANALIAGVALAALPEARVIHCRRHPMASGFSAFRLRFFEGYDYSARFSTIAAFHRLTEAQMSCWRGLFPERVRPVLYEALTEAPERWIGDLVSFCGLEPQPGLADFRGSTQTVRTASLRQVRRGIYRGSSEAWKAYAEPLLPLMAELIEEIAHYEVELDAELAQEDGTRRAGAA